uniref:Uncharacterized protein n=1 Tax=Cannabis sativa TaxID=3483 RepID=A0A803Q0Q8_CANSA
MPPLKQTPLLFPKMNLSSEIVTTSPLLFLKKILSKKIVMKNLPLLPKRLRRGDSHKDSSYVSNNYQEQESNGEDVSYESSKDSDQESELKISNERGKGPYIVTEVFEPETNNLEFVMTAT